MPSKLFLGKGTLPTDALDIWYQCARKKQYKSIKTAKKRAKDFGQYVYECPQCGGYHLTAGKKKGKNNG